MHPLQAVAVVVAGILAGMINTVVGSGTLITFPVLLAVGLPPLTANVSNGLGLVPGSLFGAIGYRDELAGQGRRLRRLGVASTIGGAGGAVLLLVLPPAAFNAIVPVLIVIALVLVVLQPWLSRKLAARRAKQAALVPATGPVETAHTGTAARPPAVGDGWLLWVGALACGIYGGYFGAAQGVLLLGLMGVLLAESLQRVNAVKNVLAMLANLASGIVFVFVAHVSWSAVVLIAVGSAVGGVLGARVGRSLSPTVLRGLIVVIGLGALAKLLFT
ncbi:MAG TPA: sulfite exporter TauE/SafE family protein [Pseudonocardiaceae bacterium]|nr:sulfite exporter TauE/SafE family protein [Pseudonocardiaceae bacterium]